MLVDGRLSVRIVAPVRKLAAAAPVFATWTFQVQLLPSVVVLLTLSVFTAVRSGAVTVTVSVQVLLFSLLSETTLPGSALQTPPVGFTQLPAPVGVARKLTSNEPGAAIDTAPLAEHVRVLLAMAQTMFPVIPVAFDMPAAP